MPELEFICSHHKPGPLPVSSAFVNIQAGRALSTQRLDMPGDDTGDNISDLNWSFSEMSAVYWYWKNRPHAELVGICHYRRFFNPWPYGRTGKFTVGRTDSARRTVPESLRGLLTSPLAVRRVQEAATGVEALVPRPLAYDNMSAADYFVSQHGQSAWDTLAGVMDDRGEDLSELETARAFFCWNMMVVPRDRFDEYCGWIFPILLDFHERFDYPDDPYERRMAGFVAERLTSMFLMRLGAVRAMQVARVGRQPAKKSRVLG